MDPAHTHKPQSHTAITSACPALEYLLLPFALFERSRWNQGPVPPLRDTVRVALSSLPRLFYVLVWADQWDLSALPEGWEMHPVPIAVEAEEDEPPLILEPKGVFSRPLEIGAAPDKRPVVLFHPDRSPVRLGQDSAAWRWIQPKRQTAVSNYPWDG